jgi:hypothetical protein
MDLFAYGRELFAVPGGEDDTPAGLGQRHGHSPADPPSGSGNERDRLANAHRPAPSVLEPKMDD